MDMGKHPPVFYFLFFLDVQGRVKSFGEETSFGVETLRAPLGGRSGNKFIIATAIFWNIFEKVFYDIWKSIKPTLLLLWRNDIFDQKRFFLTQGKVRNYAMVKSYQVFKQALEQEQ